MVVLPAPFGPMMENTSPWFDREADPFDGANAAEADADVLGTKQAHRNRSERA